MLPGRCLARLSNLDFWYYANKNTIKIGLNKDCIQRIGNIERIQFNYDYLNNYTIENNVVGYISTYKSNYDIDLHLPLRGYITKYNNEFNLNHKTWLIEILDDEYYVTSDFYKFEYGKYNSDELIHN